jgi:transcriptional regulator with XRE-family HTH domain
VLFLCRHAKLTYRAHRGHGSTRDTVCRVLTDPETPEARLGRVVRAARKRMRLSIEKGAEAVGLSKETLGYIERARNNRGGVYETSDATLAQVAAGFRIPAGELDRIGRAEAAALLRAFPPSPEAMPRGLDADTTAALDRMFGALIRDKRPSEAEALRYLWHDIDDEARLLPLAGRARKVAAWIEGHSSRQGQDGFKAVNQ